MQVECSSRIEADRGDYLQAGDVFDWVGTLPPDAHLTQIIRDYGNQRDPMPVLVGLIAKWRETRG